jgi:CheY-like chemotaxis protein
MGSTFWFEVDFPISEEWVSSAAYLSEGKIIGYTGEQKTILIVDDHEVNRVVVSEVLKPLGFRIVEASNGREGLEEVAEKTPDLVITDIVMPEMDGYVFARKVRESYSQELPIIAASASVSLGDQSLAIAAGCNDFLEKPVDMEKIFTVLQKYLNLQWIYEQPTPEDLVNPENLMIFPKAEELEEIYQAVKIGDIEVIEAEAQRLKRAEPQYTRFSDRLLALTMNFDENGIIKLLECRET